MQCTWGENLHLLMHVKRQHTESREPAKHSSSASQETSRGPFTHMSVHISVVPLHIHTGRADAHPLLGNSPDCFLGWQMLHMCVVVLQAVHGAQALDELVSAAVCVQTLLPCLLPLQ